ncbi:RsmB/NOP family class I SAM-dependent RNA methyltransferase [Paenibacillus abyssi]|uniref:SAM-dependent MTase RsmB/NOP-type domain-containing protein n=1 Tax=Paenibacillus abyssi TaxID=1340531 RepID=A0A917LDY3_9BACL|nr:RsmB/NOP family class I SAM-dependent RNA methyltransferase [Paenibacillus abyssi]GGG15274.1 hypothetical protein GCM10010916_35250 [Paenibacillus abyssi]
MGITLPIAFTTKMKKLLGSDFEAFMASYEEMRLYGLRLNRLKIDEEQFFRISPLADRLRPIPWAQGGFYYEEGDRPGKHPHYHAGLYYIQEPSAMAPAELLDVKPGHKVLDLCAAPGGKSTQLAAKLQGRGVLVANDNARERTKALAKNIELAGVRNAVVLNEEPEALAPVFAGYFDRILVDAPCSGEGMFRKEESMITQWERHSVERCAVMQHDILRHAAAMLAPGGRLVYSTCTFSPEENEAQIASLLAEDPELSVWRVSLAHGWAAGRPDWIGLQDGEDELIDNQLKDLGEIKQEISGTVRLWPHLVKGEGHYAAVLIREGLNDGTGHSPAEHPHTPEQQHSPELKGRRERGGSKGRDRKGKERFSKDRDGKGLNTAVQPLSGRGASKGRKDGGGLLRKAETEMTPEQRWQEFAASNVRGTEAWQGKLISYGSRVYLQPDGVPSLDGLRVVRAGWFLGEAGRYKFEPSQPLAMGLGMQEAVRSLQLRADDEGATRYLKGETLHMTAADIAAYPLEREGDESKTGNVPADPKGYVLVCIDGYPVGWGKWDAGTLKNELAAGWRLT